MRIRNSPLKIPSLKKLLIEVALDIDRIESNIWHTYFDRLPILHTMVLLLEDRRYFSHMGVDYFSFLRDFWRMATFRKHGGFSTIEMQFVRTVTSRYERTIKRKLYEILLAFICNWRFKKTDMLESYLRIAYFGTNYCNYIDISGEIFKKWPSDLSQQEAAMIAACLVYPMPRSPNSEWNRKIQRRSKYAMKLYASGKYPLDKIDIS